MGKNKNQNALLVHNRYIVRNGDQHFMIAVITKCLSVAGPNHILTKGVPKLQQKTKYNYTHNNNFKILCN